MRALVQKTLRDHAKPTAWWTAALLLMFVTELWAYPYVLDATTEMRNMVEAYPEALRKMFRMDDYYSGTGFLGTEMFSFMVQLVFIAIGASFGANATAGEEERGTADVLMALPITRRALLAGKMAALPIAFAGIAAAILIVLGVGMPMVDMEASLGNLAIATIASAMLGLFGAGCAYALGAVTGRRGVALGASIGVSLVSWIIYSLAPLVSAFDKVVDFTPWQWAFGNDPLNNGADLPHLALLAAVTVALYGTALWAFERRDIEA